MDKKKILVVDDETGLVEIIRMRLKQEGYDVVTAGDGEEGLKKARNDKPDLILLDVSMPKMTGEEVLAKLKADNSTKEIPVIMITAMSEVDDIVKYMTKGGAKDYIVKPFMTEDFLTKIYGALFQSIDRKVKRTLEEEDKKKK
jgi:DNA-binding response OmpR family regulator